MARLGDHFPDDEKDAYLKSHLVPGQVLYLFCPFTRPPKDKYVVLLTMSPQPLLFVVNSRIPAFAAKRPHLAGCQVLIDAMDHSFLDHDSFINCAEVIDALDREAVLSQLRADTSRLRGCVSPPVMAEIVDAVNGARTITSMHKKAVLSALRGTTG